MITVLCASKAGTPPRHLDNLGPHTLITSTTAGWGRASNELLDQAAALDWDVVFADDDTAFTEQSMAGVNAYYDQADVFGFDLHIPNRGRQGGARHILSATGHMDEWNAPGPAYVAHCSTSAIYLKAAVVKAVRFPEWDDGVHCEDVVFTVRAWLAGFRVMAVPGLVWHNLTMAGVGQTKVHDPLLWERRGLNGQRLDEYLHSEEVLAALADGRVPVGAVEL